MFTFQEQVANAKAVKNTGSYVLLLVKLTIRKPYEGFDTNYMDTECKGHLASITSDITKSTIGFSEIRKSRDTMISYTKISVFEAIRLARSLGQECIVDESILTITVNGDSLKEFYSKKYTATEFQIFTNLLGE